MKFIAVVASVSIFLGCGIISALFEMPERYIERDVSLEEMIGTWNITSDSEADVKEFVKKFPDWVAYMPFTSLTLNGDGTCDTQYKVHWLEETTSTDTSIHTTSCSWNLAEDKNLSGTVAPVIVLDFEYSNHYGRNQSMYIYEESGELIVWSFIGDPDDFRTQDFVKVK